MTLQMVARLLTKAEGGAQEVNIAQMMEIIKCLKKLLASPDGMKVMDVLLR